MDHLIKNQENETSKLVFEQVSQRLATWIDKNREIEWQDVPIQMPLVKAIGDTRYASTVRAAVRRYGNWPNLDYYHHLAFGTRRNAVRLIGGKIDQFKIIVQNLIDDDELSPAKEFLTRVLGSLAATVDTSYRNLQLAGREAFRNELESDFTFWTECEGRWGAGPGYRNAIRDMTAEQFQSSYDDAHELVKHMIAEEWGKLIALLDGDAQGKGWRGWSCSEAAVSELSVTNDRKGSCCGSIGMGRMARSNKAPITGHPSFLTSFAWYR